MRSLRFAVPVLFVLLSGCTTTNPSNITTVIQQVQAAATAICGFLPTASTVASIITAGNPLVSTVSGIASAICAAVVPTKSLRGKRGIAPPMVNGVVIRGRFVH